MEGRIKTLEFCIYVGNPPSHKDCGRRKIQGIGQMTESVQGWEHRTAGAWGGWEHSYRGRRSDFVETRMQGTGFCVGERRRGEKESGGLTVAGGLKLSVGGDL